MISANKLRLLIMYTRPPKLVGIWAAFSVPNWGYSAPKDNAMALAARVYSTIVPTATAIMNSLACNSQLVKTVMMSASTNSGTVPIQYLLQSIALGSSGLERSSHIWRPSSEILGKMKRAATAASTNPASPRFRNETERHQPEWHPLAGMKRERLDVEDVHHEEHGQQDELAPLGVVAEEQP